MNHFCFFLLRQRYTFIKIPLSQQVTLQCFFHLVKTLLLQRSKLLWVWVLTVYVIMGFSVLKIINKVWPLPTRRDWTPESSLSKQLFCWYYQPKVLISWLQETFLLQNKRRDCNDPLKKEVCTWLFPFTNSFWVQPFRGRFNSNFKCRWGRKKAQHLLWFGRNW